MNGNRRLKPNLPWTIWLMSVGHYENFPVASLLCPPALRAPIQAIYRFARTADDIADEGQATSAERLAALLSYGRELDGAVDGSPAQRWPEVFGPLRDCIDQYRLPVALLHDLLDAFAQDCSNPRYADRLQLLNYCRRSANPIGRLLLHLYGINDADALRKSDAICSALQLINFWQDPSIDLARGRNYFPLEDLQRHGLQHTDLLWGRDGPATQAVVTDLVAWARELMGQGHGLVRRLPGRIGWELGLVVQGGLRILAKIEAMEHRTLSARPRLSILDLPGMLWRCARMRAMSPSPIEAQA